MKNNFNPNNISNLLPNGAVRCNTVLGKPASQPASKQKAQSNPSEIVITNKNIHLLRAEAFTDEQRDHWDASVVSDGRNESACSASVAREKNPLIFSHKVRTNYKTISNNFITNTLGEIRHFPLASKEWANSIYSYNKNNYLKNLPVMDKTLTAFLKSYFNSALRKPQFSRSKQPKRYYPKRITSSAKRFKRLSLNKVFLGRSELKHTNDKVIITLFIYNQQKIILKGEIRAIISEIFPSRKLLKHTSLANMSASLTRTLESFYRKVDNQARLIGINSLFPWTTQGTTPVNRRIENNPIRKDSYRYKALTSPARSLFWSHLDKIWQDLMETSVKLVDNKRKFNVNHLSAIIPLISRLYSNKQVEFNIVNLKNLHLDTNILTQIIANKLKNRDNRLLRVLKSALSLVRIPVLNRVEERYGKDNRAQIWFNNVKNMAVSPNLLFIPITPLQSLQATDTTPGEAYKSSTAYLDSNLTSLAGSELAGSLFKENKAKSDKDLLSELIRNVLDIKQKQLFLSNKVNFQIEKPEGQTAAVSHLAIKPSIDYNENLIDVALQSIKHKTMSGVRLEARGRLTRRFTASRSVFKLRWKGGLDNIQASLRGLSTVLLRGHANENVQHSLLNSKNRNGAFGIKGWISAK